MSKIIQQLNSEINSVKHQTIETTPGTQFDHFDTIQRAQSYLQSEFVDKSLFHNREKIFFNITTPRKDTVVRFLDVDTKDIRIQEMNPQSFIASMLLQSEFDTWATENLLGEKLNQLVDELVSYGSIALEKTKEGAEIVDLRRLFIDPTVETILESRFITTKHYFTEFELREHAKKNNWDIKAVERLIDSKKATEQSEAPPSAEDDNYSTNEIVSNYLFEVYRRFGYVDPEDLDMKGDDQIKAVFIIAEPSFTGENGEQLGEVLYKKKWTDDFPFTDFHFLKIKGRWLGLGVPEMLFPAQERINELKNQQRISMEISSMHVFQTEDNQSFNNVLTDLPNGALLKYKRSPITPIATEERNLGAFNSEAQAWTILADRVTFANDLISGGQIPASTPATNAVLANNNAVSVHLFKRENFVLKLRRFIKDFVLPQIVKDLSYDRIVRYIGSPEQMARLDDEITKITLNKRVKELALSGEVITSPILDQVEKEVRLELKKQGNKRYVEAFKQYYEDKEFDITINIDNEQKDVGLIAQNTFSVLTAMAQNPQLLDDPMVKQLFLAYTDAVGVSAGRMELAESERATQQAQQEQDLGVLSQALPVPSPQTANEPATEGISG